MTPARALPLILATGAIWGLTPALAKIAMAAGVPPLGVAFWVALGSGLVLLALCQRRGIAIPRDRAHLLYYLAAGNSGFTLANIFGYHALQHVPAGFFALLVPLSAMITVVGAALLGQERATPRRLAGTALGFAGVALAMAPGAALPAPGLLGWALLAALTPACYALSNLLAVQMAPARGAGPLAAATGSLFGAALGLFLTGAAFGQLHRPFAEGARVEALLALQAVLTAAAYLLYFRLIAGAGAVTTSQIGYVITLAGTAWGAWLFGERPGLLTLPAAALIFAGLWLVTRR
jgi:drug/metabolite transporter (DMT)-like permease